MVSDLPNLLANQITEAMEGMSLSELARKTGLNRQQLHRYINGQAVPRADSFMKICNILHIDPWSIVDDGTKKTKPMWFETGLFGSAKNPTKDQFPPGLYELYAAHPRLLGRLSRVILIVKYNGPICTIRALLPSAIVPKGTPNKLRHISGIVKVKFQRSYYIILKSKIALDTDEDLSTVLMLEAEDVQTHFRNGVVIRFIPKAGSGAFASKVAMQRLVGTDYKTALKQPTLFSPEEAPTTVKEYFLAENKYPYHMGPSAEVKSNEETSSEKQKAHEPHRGLRNAMGGGAHPTEQQLESGVYEIHMPFSIDRESLINIPVLIGGSEKEGRWVFSRMQRRFFPGDVPRLVRDLSGQVLIKFGAILHVFGIVDPGDGGDKQSYYFRFGPLDFRTRMRFGVGLFPTGPSQAPMALKAVMAKSRFVSFAKAYRHSKTMLVSEAPESVSRYFTKDEPASYILSTVSDPQFF